jgi:hypothetical protein
VRKKRILNVFFARDPQCKAEASRCACALPRGHAGPHICTECSGSWAVNEQGEFVVVRLPQRPGEQN